MQTSARGVGPLTKADVLQLSEIGVTASVCGHYYNLNGSPCNAGIHDRVIAVEPALLRKAPYAIGISTGRHSLNATLSILRAGLVNVLVVVKIWRSSSKAVKRKPNNERGSL